MMRKLFLLIFLGVGMCCSVVFASPIFPNAFSSNLIPGKNCSVSSDIVPTFCQTSGAGSFRQAVLGCETVTKSMHTLYRLMLAAYGNLHNACAAQAKQHGGTVQGCIGQWTCYWQGGQSQDMSGLCNGNGQACSSL